MVKAIITVDKEGRTTTDVSYEGFLTIKQMLNLKEGCDAMLVSLMQRERLKANLLEGDYTPIPYNN